MKRLSIFFFFDKDGEVRDFVPYYIKSLHSISDHVCTVVNGALTDEGNRRLSEVSDTLFVRDNTGFDVWAYKEAMEQLGWDTVTSYDELILCNFTCYGPVYPFSEMFDEMAKRNCDFWGAVKHPEQPNFLLPNKQGYIYEHIMSYFTVIRSEMLNSDDFKAYWENVPKIKTKTESTAFHETVFTKHFEDLGYISDAYVNLDNYRGRCNNSSIFLADELLIKDRCPLVKRRAFAFPLYSNLLSESAGSNAIDLMKYIAENTDYDCDMIWQDLLETQKMSLLCNNMHLNRIITGNRADLSLINENISIMIFVENMDYLEIVKPYLKDIPESIRIVLLCDDAEIYENCNRISCAECRYVDVDNYSNVITSIKACADVIDASKYCCCLFSTHRVESTLSQEWEDHCRIVLDNLIGSTKNISEIIKSFISEKRIGVMRPVKSSFARYFSQPYNYVYNRLSYYSSVYHQLDLSVPMDDGTLTADLDSAFWIRSDILNKISCYLEDDNIAYALSQQSAFEYFLPMMAQEEGYYTAGVCSERNALLALDNHIFMQHHMNERMKQCGCAVHKFYDLEQFAARERGRKIVNTPADIGTILNQKIALRHILLMLMRYPANKLDNIKQRLKRKVKRTLPVGARIVNISLEGERVVFYYLAGRNTNQNAYVSVDGRKFFTKKMLTDGQNMIADYIREYKYGEPLFFELPISELKNHKIELYDANNRHQNVAWSANFCFNALELRELGLYVRVTDGDIYIQTKDEFCKSVLNSKSYSRKDKKYFRKAMSSKDHKYTLIAENGGAADNAYQLFKYAVSQGEDVLYIASEKIVNSEKDPKLKDRMVVYNSKRHAEVTLNSKRWIGSFSLRLELVPTNYLHDIHYAMLPAEWDFIPHGMAIGDKEVSMLHRYSWDNPSRTFTSVPLECEAYRNIYDFKNVCSLGAPRMDKWADAEVKDDMIMIFFTWRMAFSQSVGYKDIEQFKKSDYYNSIIHIVEHINKNFPDKKIYYVFHHEIVRNGMDAVIRSGLDDYNIEYIYFDTTEGAERFNSVFKEAKYLITDFSSAAFDFAYKKDSISIYYLLEKFIEGHYTLEEKFYQTHLGVVVTDDDELTKALKMKAPTSEMKRRKDAFFVYQDGKNSERVFNAIFREPSPESFLPENQFNYPPENVKRLGIYFFYDADGIVDDYVVYYLEKLRDVCCEVCVVVNGELTTDSEIKLQLICDKLLIRKNKGFDSWAYKEAIESYGYDYIAENYDELVLSNFTNFGPVFPFREMFDIMDKRDCDFWGHNRYIDHGSYINRNRVIDHLQSYFTVFRSSILKSEHFKKYWISLALPTTYQQAIQFHEIRYTRYFESLGFISDAFMPWRKYIDAQNAPVYFAYRQMVEDRSPLLKRKVFFNKEDQFQFQQRDCYSVYDVADYIRENTKYPMDLIADNMERTMVFPEEVNFPENDQERIAGDKSKNPKEKWELYRKANTRFDPEKLYKRKYHHTNTKG